MPKRRPLNKLCVEGRFTEDGAVWTEEPQRHYQDVYDDKEATTEKQEERIMQFRADGDRHFTKEKRIAEMTIDFVLRAKARVSEEKVNGPEDSDVTEMIKELSQEKIYQITRCFQAHFSWVRKTLPVLVQW